MIIGRNMLSATAEALSAAASRSRGATPPKFGLEGSNLSREK